MTWMCGYTMLTGPNSVKTRLQVQITKKVPGPVEVHDPTRDPHYTSTWDAITKIVDDEGLKGLYAGMVGSLIGVASTNFAYFYWYTVVRTIYLARQTATGPPGTAIELSLGAVAGALAQLFTIPVAVVTTRQQTQPKAERKGLLATAKDVIESEDGWTGLWRGLKASLVLVINPSITYGAYQRLRVLLFKDKARLQPWEAFGQFIYAHLRNHKSLIQSHSARSNVKIPGNIRHTTIDCSQSRFTIATPTVPQRQAIQELRRGHVVHHRARRCSQFIQGNWPSIAQGTDGPRSTHDDKGEVRRYEPAEEI